MLIMWDTNLGMNCVLQSNYVFGFGFLSMCKQHWLCSLHPIWRKRFWGMILKSILEINYLCKTVLKKEMSNWLNFSACSSCMKCPPSIVMISFRLGTKFLKSGPNTNPLWNTRPASKLPVINRTLVWTGELLHGALSCQFLQKANPNQLIHYIHG